MTTSKTIERNNMFKIKTLSLIFLLMFKALNLEAQEGSFEEDTIKCVNSLTKTNLPIQAETTQTDLRHGISDHRLRENHSQTIQTYSDYLTESEEQMRMQGYSDHYIAGLDHVNTSLRLVQSLRARSINPHITHIPEFADLIDLHIAFIEEGIKSQRYGDTADRLRLLEQFKAEAQYRKVSETVTYRWWFNFNLRLSILVTPKEHLKLDYFKKWMTHDGSMSHSSVRFSYRD